MAAVSQITNRGELLDAVADFVDRTDLDTVIQSLPALVEAELHRKVVDGEPLRHWRMLATDNLTISNGTALVALPTAASNTGDWLETVSLRWDTYHVKYTSPDLLDIMKRTYENGTEPSLTSTDPVYTYRGAYFELWPTPTADGILYCEYYHKIPAMTGEGTTNWLLTGYPDIYLYGCLKHLAPYLHDDERIVIWDKLFEDGVAGLQREGRQARYSGSRMTRPAPVTL